MLGPGGSVGDPHLGFTCEAMIFWGRSCCFGFPDVQPSPCLLFPCGLAALITQRLVMDGHGHTVCMTGVDPKISALQH